MKKCLVHALSIHGGVFTGASSLWPYKPWYLLVYPLHTHLHICQYYSYTVIKITTMLYCTWTPLSIHLHLKMRKELCEKKLF
jgi:hypothetical protein